MSWYTICEGADLRICRTCKRHTDRVRNDDGTVAAAFAHQSPITPKTRGEQCYDYLGAPMQREPRR